MLVRVSEEIELSNQYEVVGILNMKNGCCEDRPVVITRTRSGICSTQCACGGWCSNGHKTAAAAVLEYEHMSKGLGNWDMNGMAKKLNRLMAAVEDLRGDGCAL